ncbi:MAG: YceI family protein [Erythrobacter sp.]|nr:MAG: YceI family protein [Erythrobacter sp.]
MRKTLLALTATSAVAAFTATGAFADAPRQEAMDTSSITSGTYATDPAHSLVGWRLDHLGFNDYFGIFGDAAGTLVLDTENLENSTVDVTVPISSVTVASEGLRDHLLRAGTDGAAPDFFGPSPEPARFVSTMVHPTGETSAHIMGNLTFNGQTHPVTIEAELAGMGTNMMSQKETVGFHGTTTITRSQWGMGWGTQFGLGDEVELDITVAFEKQ